MSIRPWKVRYKVLQLSAVVFMSVNSCIPYHWEKESMRESTSEFSIIIAVRLAGSIASSILSHWKMLAMLIRVMSILQVNAQILQAALCWQSSQLFKFALCAT
mmetsp:Transcript_6015/g.22775  ORF Transcript_6015/g.22775 Transcript_6015/m.22775 type:complete len:103 (-) Transcript_6015:635-943(-)